MTDEKKTGEDLQAMAQLLYGELSKAADGMANARRLFGELLALYALHARHPAFLRFDKSTFATGQSALIYSRDEMRIAKERVNAAVDLMDQMHDLAVTLDNELERSRIKFKEERRPK